MAEKEVPDFLLKNLVRLSLSERHVARLFLPVLHLGDPAAELYRPLRFPGRRHQAEMVRSQSINEGLYQGDFKLGAKESTYDFLYARRSVYSFVQTLLYRQRFFPVFRIRDILVRIRIRGSVPLTNGSEPESALVWWFGSLDPDPH